MCSFLNHFLRIVFFLFMVCGLSYCFLPSINAASLHKARLHGMEEAYDLKGTARDERLLNIMINEERYFVILMVYDFQKLQQGGLFFFGECVTISGRPASHSSRPSKT